MMLRKRSAGAAREDRIFHLSRLSNVAFLALLFACKNSGVEANHPPGQDNGVSGIWVGLEGPIEAQLTPTARLELKEKDGVVTGTWYSSDVFPDAGSWPVGSLQGFRDGGTLSLRDNAIPRPDGGLEGGWAFSGTLATANHLDAVVLKAKRDGGPLPIYLKVDRTP